MQHATTRLALRLQQSGTPFVVARHTFHFLAHQFILRLGHLPQVLGSLVGKLPHQGLLVCAGKQLQQLVELPVVIDVVHALPPSLSISATPLSPRQVSSARPRSARRLAV